MRSPAKTTNRIAQLMFRASIPTAVLLLILAGSAMVHAGPEAQVRFGAVDIYLDSGAQPLAAFQFELIAHHPDIKIVGVEGGEHAAFQRPAYYDPAALRGGRIILAAFNTGNDLPKGRTRIATIHFQITGDTQPEYEAKLIVAASESGEKIEPSITFEGRKGGRQ